MSEDAEMLEILDILKEFEKIKATRKVSLLKLIQEEDTPDIKWWHLWRFF